MTRHSVLNRFIFLERPCAFRESGPARVIEGFPELGQAASTMIPALLAVLASFRCLFRGRAAPRAPPAVHVSSRLPRPPKPPKGANRRRPGDVDPLKMCDGRRRPGWEISAAPEVSGGAPGRTRTSDARFRKPTLYPLSYGGAAWKVPEAWGLCSESDLPGASDPRESTIDPSARTRR